jgi:hypothetical protein
MPGGLHLVGVGRSRWRIDGNAVRGARGAYFDARDYRDVGGRLEPFVAPGERFATPLVRSSDRVVKMFN